MTNSPTIAIPRIHFNSPVVRKCAAITVVLWIGAVVVGFVQLLRYGGTPEQTATEVAATGPVEFPQNSLIKQHPSGKTLVMFAHPHCPCTRASLRELSLILTERPELKPAQIVFSLPAGVNADWKNGVIVQEALRFQGVEVKWDVDEELVKLFGAKTSGYVLLFDSNGKRLFSGGITALRGHPGWNTGRGAIIALSQDQLGACNSSPIFGCPLQTKSPDFAGGLP